MVKIKTKIEDIDSLNDVYKDIAELVGYDNMVCLYSNFKGQQISFPVKLMKPSSAHTKIKQQYNGKNIKQLAKKYGYSERWIKELVKG